MSQEIQRKRFIRRDIRSHLLRFGKYAYSFQNTFDNKNKLRKRKKTNERKLLNGITFFSSSMVCLSSPLCLAGRRRDTFSRRLHIKCRVFVVCATLRPQAISQHWCGKEEEWLIQHPSIDALCFHGNQSRIYKHCFIKSIAERAGASLVGSLMRLQFCIEAIRLSTVTSMMRRT